jgi:hypothetical protein
MKLIVVESCLFLVMSVGCANCYTVNSFATASLLNVSSRLANQEKTDWIRKSFKEEKFSVLMPQGSIFSSQASPSCRNGREYAFNSKLGVFGITHCTFSKKEAKSNTAMQLVETPYPNWGAPVATKNIKIGRYIWSEHEYRIKKSNKTSLHAYSRQLLIDGQFYCLLATQEGQASIDDVQAFFDSFRLVHEK